MTPCIPLIPSMRPRSRKHATSWAFCDECKRLHLGIVGAAVLCRHLWPNYSTTTAIIDAREATSVTDSGWRYELEPA